MPRKKKIIEPILGFGTDPDNKLIVQKSIPLASLWRSDMTLAEFKILDTYLSRIDSHHPEKRTVIFTKGELEQLLGVTRINKSDLSARLNGLGRFVEIEKSDKKIHKIALFEEAYGEMDENGLWQVKLTCTPSAMQYIFNIEEMRYLRYKLRSAICLNSRYTYILFLYLEKNRWRKVWEEDVDELRRTLKCDDDESYSAFKVFNDRILKRCQKELHEKTDCRFTYVPIKKGRKVVKVRFTLETLVDILPEAELPGQLGFDDFDANDPIAFLSGACGDEFTKEQMEVIFTLINLKELPEHPQGIDFARYHYLQRQYAMMNMQAARKPIKNRFNYFKSMLENDN